MLNAADSGVESSNHIIGRSELGKKQPAATLPFFNLTPSALPR